MTNLHHINAEALVLHVVLAAFAVWALMWVTVGFGARR
jgi:hypothetical protein